MNDTLAPPMNRPAPTAASADKKRLTLVLVAFFALVIVVFGTIQALLPTRIAGQLPDQALVSRGASQCGACTGQQKILGAGVQILGKRTFVTVRFAAPASSARVLLHFIGSSKVLTLSQNGSSAPWTATTSGSPTPRIEPVGAGASGSDVVISLSGTSLPKIWVSTPSGDRLPQVGALSFNSPANTFNLVDFLLIVLLVASFVVGWRRGLRTEARLAAATVVTLVLAFALYPVVSSVLAGANHSHVGDAVSYGLLLAAMSLVGLLVARGLEPKIANWRTPNWSQSTSRSLSGALSTARVMLVSAAVMSILSGVANFNSAAGAIETSFGGNALVHQWESIFPVTKLTPDAGTQVSLTSAAGATSSPSGPCGAGNQVQNLTMTNVATGSATHFVCGGPGGYASTPISKYAAYFNEYLAFNGTGIQLVVTSSPFTGTVNRGVSANVSAVLSGNSLADVDFYDNSSGALDYATSGQVTLHADGTVDFHNVRLVFNGAVYLLGGTMFSPAPGAVVNNQSVVAASYRQMIAVTNALFKTFDTKVAAWTAKVSSSTAQQEAAPVLSNLIAIPAQLRHFGTLYAPAKVALSVQLTAVTALVRTLESLQHLSSLGITTWDNTYYKELRNLIAASSAVRGSLGLQKL